MRTEHLEVSRIEARVAFGRASSNSYQYIFRTLQTRRVLYSTRQLRTLTHEPFVKKTFQGFLIIIIKKQFRSGEVNYSYTPSNQFELISVLYKSTNKYSLNIQLSCTQLHYSEDKGWQSSQILL